MLLVALVHAHFKQAPPDNILRVRVRSSREARVVDVERVTVDGVPSDDQHKVMTMHDVRITGRPALSMAWIPLIGMSLVVCIPDAGHEMCAGLIPGTTLSFRSFPMVYPSLSRSHVFSVPGLLGT